MPELEPPPEGARDGMVFGTNRSRLAQVTSRPVTPEEPVTFSESEATLGRYRTSGGIDNPFGTGLAAYEPNTVLFSEYQNAHGRVQDAKNEQALKDAIAKGSTTTYNFGAPAGAEGAGGGIARLPNLPDATGMMGKAIDFALELANRRVPYVWGGTTRNGVDCSGMLYYAFKAAGIDTKRYRAVDYGKMGVQVSMEEARPGDIVYFDNKGDTDHVGLYLGNGQMVQAPQTGDVVRVTNVGKATSFRRVFNDEFFAQAATPSGGSNWVYGATSRKWNTPATPVKSNTISRRMTGAFA